MMLYPGSTVQSVLSMPAATFFALLKEGSKIEVVNMKAQLAIVSYPHMKEDDQTQLREQLVLPEDILNDILEDESYDDLGRLKEILEGN